VATRQVIQADSTSPGVVLKSGTLTDSATPLPGGVGYYQSIDPAGIGAVPGTLDTDGTLAANSDIKVASQKATKTYADTKIAKSAFTAADKLLYSTAASAYAETGITSASRGILADTTAWSWDATNKVITIGPNSSPTAMVLRTPSSPTPDVVNDAATFILCGQTYPFLYWKNTNATVNKGMILGLNGAEGYFAVRDNWPLKIYTNNTLRMTIAAAGTVTIATGLEVSDLTAGKKVYTTTNGRLTTTPQAEPVINSITTKATADSPYSLGATDCTILCNAAAGNMTINLSASAGAGMTGRIVRIKKIDASANTVTVDANASETIDGALTQVLSVRYAWLVLQCDGSNWHIVG
jgi:hypothetical protein